MKLSALLIACSLVILAILPSLINAGEEPRRMVETIPKKILVFGSFLAGRKQFMMESAATIKSKGDLRQVYYLIPEYSSDADFLKANDIVPIVIPGLTQEIINKQIEDIKS